MEFDCHQWIKEVSGIIGTTEIPAVNKENVAYHRHAIAATGTSKEVDYLVYSSDYEQCFVCNRFQRSNLEQLWRCWSTRMCRHNKLILHFKISHSYCLFAATPWGGLPVLEVNGKTVIGQSMALARFAAREAGEWCAWLYALRITK